MGNPRVILVSGHGLFRNLARGWLARELNFAIVAECADSTLAYGLVKKYKPDILLWDQEQPTTNEHRIVSRVVSKYPALKVAHFSPKTDPATAQKLLGLGVRGCFQKDSPMADLELGLRVVMGGGTYCCPGMSKSATAKAAREPRPAGPLSKLSRRQFQILKLVVRGCPIKRIAGLLKISAKTVETHKNRLMRRLKLTNVQGLMKYAIKRNIVKI